MNDFSNLNVLAVDDSPLVLILLKKLLSPYHFQLRTANDKDSTLAAIAETKPDILLLDVQLFDYNGLGIVRMLRADDNLKDVRVICFSAWTSDSDIQAGFDAGANDYITKPIKPQVLYDALNKQIQSLGYNVETK